MTKLDEACELICPNDLESVHVYRARVKFSVSVISYDKLQRAQAACSEVLDAPCGCQARVRMLVQAMPIEPGTVMLEPFLTEYLFECWGNRAHVYPLVELVMSTLVHPH